MNVISVTDNASGQLANFSNPFTKLDVTNGVSFQTISILFQNEPAQPPSSSPYYSNTLLYSFAHGYSYIPSIWMNWQNDSPESPASPSSGNSATTFYAFGDDTAGSEALYNIQNSSPLGGVSIPYIATTLYNNSGSVVNTTNALLYCTVDTENVDIYVMKQTIATIGGNVIPLLLGGVTLNIRCYVFTEPATTSTY